MGSEVMMMLIGSGITGIISTIGTVAALRVHISYLRESIDRIDTSLIRAHDRIDRLEKA